MIVLVPLVAIAAVAAGLSRPWERVPPDMRPAMPPEHVRGMSIDLGLVTDPDTDWDEVAGRLDQVDATTVTLGAGRVEFTAFDWDEHPEDAAEPGRDHLTRAARAVHESGDGVQRQVGLVVDAFVPRWIERDPSVAGRSVTGEPAVYQASATQLARGEVGRRLVAYVAALGERYDPASVAVTELFLDFCFGDDDLALFRSMTGADDWPRDGDGDIDTGSAAIARWRADVIAGLLRRMRTALDEVRDGAGTDIELAMDVRVDWDDPAAGYLASGHDYRVMLEAAGRLVLWSYVVSEHEPREVTELTADLAEAGLDTSRLEMSVGLWAGASTEDRAISAETLAATVRAAATNGVTAVGVTPYSLMDDARWRALAAVWNPGGA